MIAKVIQQVLYWLHRLLDIRKPSFLSISNFLLRIQRVTERITMAPQAPNVDYWIRCASSRIRSCKGLLLRKIWADYFIIITTAGLIPLELYEIARHFIAVKVLVLVVNVAIVVYLVVRVRHGRDFEGRDESRTSERGGLESANWPNTNRT